MNWLPEEDLKGLSDDFFDDFINHMDFPLEDVGEGGDWDAKFQDLEPPPMDMFPSLPFSRPLLKQSTSSGALSVINSQSSSPPDIKVSKLFQSSSPVSVLETTDASFTVKGMRSKRKRPTTLTFRYLFPFEPSNPKKFTLGESESQTYCSSSEQHATKKRKILPTSHTVSSNAEASNSDGMVRKCTHCETTKTPQWREGPNGPKTLCNACGVRFRSGRLVPEYRPASSPTFIPSVHSNSHRKIIEMRRKDDGQFDTSMIHAVISGA